MVENQPGGAEIGPWAAADALREVADAQRAASAATRPSPWPRVIQALTLGTMLGLNAFPSEWTIVALLAVPILGLALARRAGRDRTQLNGMQVPGQTALRLFFLIGALATIFVVTSGRIAWEWPWWAAIVGGALVAGATFAIHRWFDLRLWREWSGR